MINYLITGILMLSVFGTGQLSIEHYQQKISCPLVVGLPACYVIGVCFILTLISHFVTHRKVWYFLFIAIPFLLALSGSILELLGHDVCPKTNSGIPMCFISLFICTTLLILKIYQRRS